MENIAIIYATKTKHSKKIADAVGDALHVRVANIKEQPDVTKVELLFIVSGIYGGTSLPALLTYINEMKAPQLKRVAIITSCASGTQHQDALRHLLEEKGIEVVEELVVKGAFFIVSWRHPNGHDLQQATSFAQTIARAGSLQPHSD
ncbi:MAG: flavodoxin family protein [Erysipelotrichaceae bacterium]